MLYEVITKPAHECEDLEEMLQHLDNINLPPLKIALTGDGRVAHGVLEILNYMKVMRVSPEAFLNEQEPEQAIYVQLLPGNYAKRTDGEAFDLMHFFNNPTMYENAFQPFAKATDMLIASAYVITSYSIHYTKLYDARRECRRPPR